MCFAYRQVFDLSSRQVAIISKSCTLGDKKPHSACDLEEREVYFAIDSLLGELGQVAEVVGAGVLDDDECAGLHHVAVEDELRELWQLWQVVGRVGEDEIKLARAGGYELEHVALHLNQVLLVEQGLDLADEIVLRGGLLHAGDAGAAAREEFEADSTSAREQVEGGHSVEIHEVVEHVEEVLARHVGSGARGDVGGHVETPSPIFSADDSHDS